jgi:hypothetical protein
MGKVLAEITEREAAFIAAQHVFFVATAPLSPQHHVSVSPKAGLGSAVVLNTHEVAYADLTGSGAETAAHVRENGRMTLLFCNLEKGAPKILRLHGIARVVVADDVPTSLRDKFPLKIVQSAGFRAVFILHVTRISTSCGYSLPIFDFVRQRTTLDEYTAKEGARGMFDYQTLKNSFSIDGLPSIALLRHNSPRNVVPVTEEGFVFGKDQPPRSTATRSGSLRKTIVAAWHSHQRTLYHALRRPRLVSWWKILALCTALFGAGVFAGAQLVRARGL